MILSGAPTHLACCSHLLAQCAVSLLCAAASTPNRCYAHLRLLGGTPSRTQWPWRWSPRCLPHRRHINSLSAHRFPVLSGLCPRGLRSHSQGFRPSEVQRRGWAGRSLIATAEVALPEQEPDQEPKKDLYFSFRKIGIEILGFLDLES